MGMRELIYNNFEHFLCALILLARAGDIGSTFLVSPKLKLEANPIARRLGWQIALLSLLLCLVAYFNTVLAVIVLIPSLLVSASNISKVWMARTLGEEEFDNLLLCLARKSRLSHAIAGVLGSAFFILIVGLFTVVLCDDPGHNWGYWIGYGIILYSAVIAIYGSLFFVRLFKRARAGEVRMVASLT
jgi:hypothetical protein